jgi:hypothetical protein
MGSNPVGRTIFFDASPFGRFFVGLVIKSIN